MKKEIFIKLLRLATQGQFFYKDILYKQIDGVTMGSPLGPKIANFFLANLENRILKNKNNILRNCIYVMLMMFLLFLKITMIVCPFYMFLIVNTKT